MFWIIEPDKEDDRGLLFAVVPGDAPAPRPHVKLFGEINKRIAVVKVRPSADDEVRKSQVEEIQRQLAKRLGRIADRFVGADDSLDESEGLVDVGRAWGRYEEQMADLNSPEYARLSPNDTDPTELHILSDVANTTAEQQSLIVDIYRTKTVVEIVTSRSILRFKDISEVDGFELSKNKSTISAYINNRHRRIYQEGRRLRVLYFRELKEIIEIACASKEGVFYAQKRLEAFREAFVSREAEIVKNHHVRRLGLYAFSIGLLSLSPLTVMLWTDLPEVGNNLIRSFCLIAAASCAGTWLSFSIRKVSISFTELAGLEEDKLNPGGRIVFVMLLSCLLGLLLYSNIITLKLGEPKFSLSEAGLSSALYAVIFGALCGVAERSLSGLVSSRANDLLGVARTPPADKPEKKQ